MSQHSPQRILSSDGESQRSRQRLRMQLHGFGDNPHRCAVNKRLGVLLLLILQMVGFLVMNAIVLFRYEYVYIWIAFVGAFCAFWAAVVSKIEILRGYVLWLGCSFFVGLGINIHALVSAAVEEHCAPNSNYSRCYAIWEGNRIAALACGAVVNPLVATLIYRFVIQCEKYNEARYIQSISENIAVSPTSDDYVPPKLGTDAPWTCKCGMKNLSWHDRCSKCDEINPSDTTPTSFAKFKSTETYHTNIDKLTPKAAGEKPSSLSLSTSTVISTESQRRQSEVEMLIPEQNLTFDPRVN